MHRHTLRLAAHGAILAAVICLVAAAPAHAYVDPGSGSYLFQFMIAGIAGSVYAVKTFWGRIRPFFLQRTRKPEQD
jgi:hypothetical protein